MPVYMISKEMVVNAGQMTCNSPQAKIWFARRKNVSSGFSLLASVFGIFCRLCDF